MLTETATERVEQGLDELAGVALEDWYGGQPFITDAPAFSLSIAVNGKQVDTGYIPFARGQPLEGPVPIELSPVNEFVWDLYEAFVTCEGRDLVELDDECDPLASSP